MQLGFCSVILGDLEYEEVIKTASQLGLRTVELACWPSKEANRRYAGVCHVDVNRVIDDESYYHDIVDCAATHQISISALAYYPNVLDSDLTKRSESIAHLKQVILAS